MRRFLVWSVAAFLPVAVAAQSPVNSVREDSTLVGIKTVGLLVSDVDKSLGAQLTEQLAASTQLELRKAGLRVVRIDSTGKAPGDFDALVQVQFYRRGRFAGDDVDMRFLVRQPVTLLRTSKLFWETTWQTERRGQNLEVKTAAPKFLTEAVNDFLSKWLDMNGR